MTPFVSHRVRGYSAALVDECFEVVADDIWVAQTFTDSDIPHLGRS